MHSGKSNLLELIEKLEQHFGRVSSATADKNLGTFDVTIIGGGPAGVAAAIYTARKGLRTSLITERVGGQVLDTKGIENFISVPYTEGPDLSNALRTHLQKMKSPCLSIAGSAD
ncbi:MAG: FAD-dependent oxidoreductase [Bdellovibrionota bacterium]